MSLIEAKGRQGYLFGTVPFNDGKIEPLIKIGCIKHKNEVKNTDTAKIFQHYLSGFEPVPYPEEVLKQVQQKGVSTVAVGILATLIAEGAFMGISNFEDPTYYIATGIVGIIASLSLATKIELKGHNLYDKNKWFKV